jgi:hypothetical protein
MKISFKMKVGRDQAQGEKVGESIERVGLEQVREQIQKRVEGLRCPEHDQTAQVEISGQSLGELKVNIVACCDKLRNRALQALK